MNNSLRVSFNFLVSLNTVKMFPNLISSRFCPSEYKKLETDLSTSKSELSASIKALQSGKFVL